MAGQATKGDKQHIKDTSPHPHHSYFVNMDDKSCVYNKVNMKHKQFPNIFSTKCNRIKSSIIHFNYFDYQVR